MRVSIGPGPDRTDKNEDRISQKVKTEDRTECGRSGPTRQNSRFVVRTGPTKTETELAQKPRPRTGPNVVGPVRSNKAI